MATERKRRERQRTQQLKKDIIRDAKDRPCTDCGTKYPYYVMDLDHVPGCNKVASVNHIRKNLGVQALRDEIAKCEPVCANCHRERTQQRL